MSLQDPKLLAALVENRKRQAPYTGAFLVKDEEATEGSDTDKNIHDLKGKELLNRLHDVGTLAQVTSSSTFLSSHAVNSDLCSRDLD